MSNIGRYDPEQLVDDGSHWEEHCPQCVSKEDSFEDLRSCGSCFGIDKDGTTRYQYKNFKKEK